ncbi:MAG: ParA family protein [Gemmataceae bacterium]|nr:ParA family protein [Gemmataceae bacterium]
MIEFAQKAFRWLMQRWDAAGPFLRIVYLLAGLALITAVVVETPALGKVKEWFTAADPRAQSAVLIFLAVCALGFLVYSWERAARTNQLKDDNAQLKARLEGAENEVRQHQERQLHLLEVESRAGLWKRPCQVAAPGFVPKGQRRTRFLTVLNLQGGVGKTTLAANLTACLGSGSNALRVLLIDIDFQGTLGDAAVELPLIRVQKQNNSFVNLLLTTPHPDDGLIARLAVPMTGVEAARVILSTDLLDADEFRLQARFFIDPAADPRFQFRRHLHSAALFEEYDLVVFDCPPRVTTSVVNALASSDFVLIPTRLDTGSIDAVPRTVSWMRSLGPNCPAEVVGVVVGRAAVRAGKLTKADQGSYDELRGRVQSECGPGLLFKAVVPSTATAVGPDRGQVAATTADGRKLFAPVADELRRRMQL